MEEKKEEERFIESQAETRPTFDDVLDKLGNPGRFQLFQIALALNSVLLMTFMSMSIVFLGYEPSHVCNQVENKTSLLEQHGLLNDSTASISHRSCDLVISSNQTGRHRDVLTTSCPRGRNFSDKKQTTWLSNWDLACESSGLVELTFSCYNFGFIIGGFIAPILADRYGRRIVFLTGYFLSFLWECLVLFAPNIYYVIACRFLTGLSRPGISETCVVLSIELIVPRHREYFGIALNILWVFDMFVVGLVAYIFQDDHWRYFQSAAAMSALFCFIYPFILTESPRWLSAKNRHEEALAVFKKACGQNGKNFEEIKALYRRSIAGTEKDKNDLSEKHEMVLSGESGKDTSVKVQIDQPKVSFFRLLFHCDVLIFTLSTIFIWFANNITYYGLYMTSSSLTGDRFLNYYFMGLVELPANLLVLYTMKKFNRLSVLRLFMTLAGISLLVSTLVITFGETWAISGTLMTVFFIFGKLSIAASYTSIIIITPEMFPTKLRTTGYAICDCLSRTGSIFAPFLRPLMATVTWGPGLTFTAIIAVALALMKFLPETKNRKLVDTVPDFRKILRGDRSK